MGVLRRQVYYLPSYSTAMRGGVPLRQYTGLEIIGWFIKEGLWVLPHLSWSTAPRRGRSGTVVLVRPKGFISRPSQHTARPQRIVNRGTFRDHTGRHELWTSKQMSEWLVPTIMGMQAIALALISRLRWRCYPDPETGRCSMVSGCTEHSLQDSGGIDAQEFVIADQRVLLVSGKIN